MPRLGFRLWFRNFLQRINTIQIFKHLWQGFVVLGLPILGIWLAFTANTIANASYNLSKNDTSQQAQLNQLRDVINNQKIQIDRLITVSEKIQKQNELAQQQNKELTSQGKKISENLVINQNQQKTSLQILFQQRKGNFNQIRKTFNQIVNLCPGRGKTEMMTYDDSQRVVFLNNLNFLLEKELNNPYLLEDSAFDEWYKLYNNVSSEIASRKLNLRMVVVTDNGQHPASEHEQEENHLWLWENHILGRYFKFWGYMFNTFIPKGYKEFKLKL